MNDRRTASPQTSQSNGQASNQMLNREYYFCWNLARTELVWRGDWTKRGSLESKSTLSVLPQTHVSIRECRSPRY